MMKRGFGVALVALGVLLGIAAIIGLGDMLRWMAASYCVAIVIVGCMLVAYRPERG